MEVGKGKINLLGQLRTSVSTRPDDGDMLGACEIDAHMCHISTLSRQEGVKMEVRNAQMFDGATSETAPDGP